MIFHKTITLLYGLLNTAPFSSLQRLCSAGLELDGRSSATALLTNIEKGESV
jgi:hypothetical protein